mmetsp:Transcript_1413/g.4565  ORF Transcript_1413/g.4565 Transcript_1413/m.4565 type:complete len:368 (+) Transcript_1413:1407-2510(+)
MALPFPSLLSVSRTRSMRCPVVASATTGTRDTGTTVAAKQPAWTGEDSLPSRLVNLLIASPLFPLLKIGARQQLQMTAEKNDIPWRKTVERLRGERERLQQLYDVVVDRAIEYPAYYTRPFHAYDEGNLNWLAGYEVEPATYSMAMRVWPDEPGLSPSTAQARLRSSCYDHLKVYLGSERVKSVNSVIDVGCSTGVSTRYLARAFPEAEVTGLDLSPHFLSVAMLRQEPDFRPLFEEEEPVQKNISYMHANFEHSGLGAGEYDVVMLQFVIHELPAAPTKAMAEEAMRVLRPGGVLALVDNDPQSPVIQNLPAAIFSLMKSTEPHSDEYYAFSQEENLEAAGFVDVCSTAVDPRHRLILARKPSKSV